MTVLSDSLLAAELGDAGIACELVAETGSTNADLLERARAQAPVRPVLRAARRQTQGRGRRGSAWYGAENGSLLFSLALPWQLDAAASSAVTLACGLAVARMLAPRVAPQGAQVRVKWPNDILLDGAKLAGILTELAQDGAGARTLVVGMGVNLAIDAHQRERISAARSEQASAAALEIAALDAVLGPSVLDEPHAWLARFALALADGAARFAAQGFAPMRAEFDHWCAFRGQMVQMQGGGTAWGILQGVDAQGRLLLAGPDGLVALNSGEPGVLPAPAPALAAQAGS